MKRNDCIVGIDLGTTYSEIAACVDGRVKVLSSDGRTMLPSCVGMSMNGELLLGEAARNQHLLYPERTAVGIKRRMGLSEKITLGTTAYTPQEISSLILRELRRWAEEALGHEVSRAVITVPAYFSDAQRQATREAGALAGLEVLRILNEPTAAGLAFGCGDGTPRTVMIYDLGGGTFDVSLVRIEGDVTEVLASHGNNRLGGNDFTDALLDVLLDEFKEAYGIDLRDAHPAAYSRLWWACEDAKRTLSSEPYAVIREESLLSTAKGIALHVEREVSREEFEALLAHHVETTLESVAKAMDDAGLHPDGMDTVLLVGGSTRIPLVAAVLRDRLGIVPRQDVHPDLCVALGAGVLASRLAGHQVDHVLLDVSPYSFGPSYLGEIDGVSYPHCYHPIIARNTPLPVTRTERYYTASPFQTTAEIRIYQGDDPDALKNVLIGDFKVTGLTPTEEPNEVLCRMQLDIDGILRVTAIEKCTGNSKQVTITNALKPMTADELAAARERLATMFASRAAEEDHPCSHAAVHDAAFVPVRAAPPAGDDTAAPPADAPAEKNAGDGGVDWSQTEREARALIERCRALFNAMHPDDREEAIGLNEQIDTALAARDRDELSCRVDLLKELLFFVEGK